MIIDCMLLMFYMIVHSHSLYLYEVFLDTIIGAANSNAMTMLPVYWSQTLTSPGDTIKVHTIL